MPVTFADMMERFTPEERAEIESGARAIVAEHKTLRELRRLIGLTRADLAKALKTTQGNVAQIESAGDVKISTLARITRALGGKLEVRVALPATDRWRSTSPEPQTTP